MIEPARLPPAIEASEAGSRVLECAVRANAAYLVTGDGRHLLPLEEHEGVRIVNAPRSLSILEEQAPLRMLRRGSCVRSCA